MKRRDDSDNGLPPKEGPWLARLKTYIARVHDKPFAYGEHDCALFVAGAVEAMTGEDLAREFRRAYDDLAGGMQALMRAGFSGPVDLLRSRGVSAIPVSRAKVGDLAMIDSAEGPALGVVQGGRIFYVGPTGLRTVDLLDARVAFEI